MNEGYFTITLCRQAQVALAAAHEFTFPFAVTLVNMSLCASAFPSNPTTFNVDVLDDGADIITAHAASTAGTPVGWESTHFGGSNAPLAIAKDSVIAVDINFTGGSSPSADYTLIIGFLMGAA